MPGYTVVNNNGTNKNMLDDSESDINDNDAIRNGNNYVGDWKKISKTINDDIKIRNNYSVNSYKSLSIFGQEVLGCYPVYNNVINQVIMVSYKDSIYLTLTIDDEKFQEVEDILIPAFFAELSDLAESAFMSQLQNPRKSLDSSGVRLLEKYVKENNAKYKAKVA